MKKKQKQPEDSSSGINLCRHRLKCRVCRLGNVDVLVFLYRQGYSPYKLAPLFDVTASSIYRHVRALRIDRRGVYDPRVSMCEAMGRFLASDQCINTKEFIALVKLLWAMEKHEQSLDLTRQRIYDEEFRRMSGIAVGDMIRNEVNMVLPVLEQRMKRLRDEGLFPSSSSRLIPPTAVNDDEEEC